MHWLIVLAHPDPDSLTHAVARAFADGLSQGDPDATFEFADLAAEGFDPRFTANDQAVALRRAAPGADVRAEQDRLERADALVLVYPVFWWSFPALLKGWIDRVLTNGWAYDEVDGQPLRKRLQHLPVHLVALGGADLRTYARHGYFGAMKTQIDHGIFDYCGARVVRSELLVDGQPADRIEAARALGQRLSGPSAHARHAA